MSVLPHIHRKSPSGQWLLLWAALLLPACSLSDKEDPGALPVVSTLKVTAIGENSATAGGNITSAGGLKITRRGLVWATHENPDKEDNLGMTTEGAGSGFFQSKMTGLALNTGYYVRAYASNRLGTAYGNAVTFTTRLSRTPRNQPCPGTPTMTDADGNSYPTVQIGNQCWMKENLRTTQYRNGSSIVYAGTDSRGLNLWRTDTQGAYTWPLNDPSLKEDYGALYNWHAVNNPGDLCPVGWRAPTDNDWQRLRDYLVDNYQGITAQNVGNYLKSCRQEGSPLGGECATTTDPYWLGQGTHHGSDSFGFSALAAGHRGFVGSYSYFRMIGKWWTQDPYTDIAARYYGLSFNTGQLIRSSGPSRDGYSVRCIREW